MRSRSALFLDAHPRLRDARARSVVWPALSESAALELNGRRVFIVAGDTLGDEDDLYLGELARGASDQDDEAASRRLFLELEPELRQVVERELLQRG